MEQETPKMEETVVAETVVTAGETAEIAGRKQALMAKAKAVKDFVYKMDRTTKSFIIVFGVFALLLGAFTYFKGVFIVATVNGDAISRLSVIQELEKQGGKGALDTIITKRLIADEVRKQKIVVSTADVDAEVKKAEDQVAAQGETLEAVLAGQGMSMADLREQIMINKQLEKILVDKIVVSDEDINQYLSSAQGLGTKGVSSEDQRTQAKEQLKAQKFNQEASLWLKDLNSKATIEYFVKY